MPKKLLLRCGLSPGDIIMLTAAVRDLHVHYPGQFLTDVRTCCPDIWENNPNITPLSQEDAEVEAIECSYPLIDRCNSTPYHCLHGFITFLNKRLGLSIRPTTFKGDIHLSEQEKTWYSQVHEVTGHPIPFWIVAAGGKYDVTIKWWHSERYQQVINHFRDKVQFVQVGDFGHHHPKLEGCIDLRGQTSFRELIRLVYNSQGVLCSITALMHLAAAVETKKGQAKNRPCVVIAGGREPAHWEAYPSHQFIHTNGALTCCENGGCWKDRIEPLRDGDPRDRPDRLCVNTVNHLPRCMDMIGSEEVIRRIRVYFDGGVLKYLSPTQLAFAEQGVKATQANSFDSQCLNLSSAGMACDQFIQTLSHPPRQWTGRGIVICGGGVKYFPSAWVCVKMLRHLGCRLPVQLWYLGRKELNERMKAIMAPLDVECVNACTARKKFPARILKGWELKSYALLYSPFQEVLLLDADNVPVVNPEFLFDTPQFRATGAIFWPDFGCGSNKRADPVWRSCGMRPHKEREFESGQIVVNKQRCWRSLKLSAWFNDNSDFYYRYLHGDKETFHLAFRKMKQKYALIPHKIKALTGTMCQHDFDGNRIFQHRNLRKWNLNAPNKRTGGFWLENECRMFLKELRRKWSGKIT